jgi:hypothetical protein
MLNQGYVPNVVKIAQAAPAFSPAEFDYVDLITASRLGNSMQRLVNVRNEVDQEFQRLGAIGN